MLLVLSVLFFMLSSIWRSSFLKNDSNNVRNPAISQEIFAKNHALLLCSRGNFGEKNPLHMNPVTTSWSAAQGVRLLFQRWATRCCCWGSCNLDTHQAHVLPSHIGQLMSWLLRGFYCCFTGEQHNTASKEQAMAGGGGDLIKSWFEQCVCAALRHCSCHY